MSRLGPLTIDDTFRPHPRAGAIFSRTLEISGLSQGQTVWLHPGPGSSIARLAGGSSESVGEAVKVTSQGDKLSVVLEVLP
ncbi:MAG: hypothetical protein IPJ41_11715 [Phycisphaerales bacterium]|nr:hypothetical protein [Phycisphaerales bacterium]